MDPKKQKLLEKTYDQFFQACLLDDHFPLNKLDELVVRDFMGYGTAGEEVLNSVSDLKDLIIKQRKEGASIEKKIDIRPVKRIYSENGNMAIIVDEADLKLLVEGTEINMHLRVSSVFEYQNEKWVGVHFHSSTPAESGDESDTWHIRAWQKRMEELERQVAEKTSDLAQKNRELEIEASLERVRAKAMAMHSTKDISEAIAVVFNELTRLGVEMERCGIVTFNDTPTIGVFSTRLSPQKTEVIDVVTGSLNTNIHPLLQSVYKSWKDKQDYLTYELKGKEVKNYYDLLEKAPDYRFPKIAKYKERQILNLFNFSEGGVFAFSNSQLPDDVVQIFLRFTKVFSHTYRRYIDLTNAEKQVREAQIEAALERVRAQTMSMHSSSDIGATVTTFFEELISLGLPDSIRCGVGILSQSVEMQLWTASDVNKTGVQLHTGRLDMTQHPLLSGVKQAWKQGNEFFSYELKGGDMMDYFTIVNAAPDYPANIPLDTLPEAVSQYSFIFPDGVLYAFSQIPLPSEIMSIFRRFAVVFGQTYTRFLDLQKAEAHAKETIKQASIDRIRAEIASMRTTKDLEKITPLIWKELSILEVPFFRCGVFIIDEVKAACKVYLTTPEGESLAAMELPFGSSELVDETVHDWRAKKILRYEWNKEEFVEWTKSLIEQGFLKDATNYQGNEQPPDHLSLHFVPFSQGMLYVGSETVLSEEHLELVQLLAQAFSVAYARYEDFNQLEKTLEELKAAQSQLIHSEKMASLGELTAGIAHEIKNPLNFVNNFSELNAELIEELEEEIKKGDFEEAKIIARNIKENEQKIVEHGKRADGIVQSMLQHSHGGTHEKELTDLNALADEYLKLAYHGMRARDKSFNVQFETDFDPKLPKIEVIPQDIGRVLLNLINNAFYAVSETHKEREKETASSSKALGMEDSGYKPKVIVSTKTLGDKIKISVKDNGPGIPASIKEKIFQPFFTTKPTGQGTGLGLSLSYDIVKAHGGELKVESLSVDLSARNVLKSEAAVQAGEEGVGSTFIIYLNSY